MAHSPAGSRGTTHLSTGSGGTTHSAAEFGCSTQPSKGSRGMTHSPVMSGAVANYPATGDMAGDTMVYPLVQMGPFGITQDEGVTGVLLRGAARGATIHLATGYFNLTDEYARCVVSDCSAHFEILTSVPEVSLLFCLLSGFL